MYNEDEKKVFKKIILDRVAKGDSLLKILETQFKIEDEEIIPLKKDHKQEHFIKMPSRPHVYTWFHKSHEYYDESFFNNYARARQDSGDLDVDKLEQIVEDVRHEKISPNQGRVMADILKWTAGRKKPKKYGDKIDVTSDDKPINSVVLYLPDNGRKIEDE